MKAYAVSFIVVSFFLSLSVNAVEQTLEPVINHLPNGDIEIIDGAHRYTYTTNLPDDELIQLQSVNSFNSAYSTSSSSTTPTITCNGNTSCDVSGFMGDRITVNLGTNNDDANIWTKGNTSHCLANRECQIQLYVPNFERYYYYRVNAVSFKNGTPYNIVRYIRVTNRDCYPGDPSDPSCIPM